MNKLLWEGEFQVDGHKPPYEQIGKGDRVRVVACEDNLPTVEVLEEDSLGNQRWTEVDRWTWDANGEPVEGDDGRETIRLEWALVIVAALRAATQVNQVTETKG